MVEIGAPAHEDGPILRVRGLGRWFGRGCPHCLTSTGDAAGRNTCPACGTVVALAGVDVDLWPGEVLGIIGESGSGKSSLIRLLHLDDQADAGSASLRMGNETVLLGAVDAAQARHIKDRVYGMVHQHPHLGLNLGVSAGANIAERLLCAGGRDFAVIRARAASLLERTEVPVARMDHSPRQFSGGMQQRLQIARALAPDPQVLFLDEVTTGLDVSVQARILDLILELNRTLGVAMVVVTHDLGVVRLLASRTLVLRQGRVVESGLTDQVLEDPQHPYTQQLVQSAL